MWIPESAAELEQALAQGGLEETATFDGKRELGKSEDIAVDVCAMTVQGGVLLYGAGENADKTRLTEAHPFVLPGRRERVSQIARAGISEPPTIEIRALERDGSPGEGYLIVHVPQSARAPHQVILKGKHEGRFYGRDATGNRILTQVEVEQLYARRGRWERDALAEAEDAFRARSAAAYAGGADRAFLFLRIKPLGGTRELLATAGRANGGNEEAALAQAIEVARGCSVHSGYSPDFVQLGGWVRSDADHFTATHTKRDKPELQLSVAHDGTITLLSRRVGERMAAGFVAVFEPAIAGLVKRGLAFAGRLYGDAGYSGAVDVALIVRPLSGTFGMTRIDRLGDLESPYPTEEYRRSERPLASELADDPEQTARRLVMDLTDALVGRGFEPFHRVPRLPLNI
jgi:hypothetical protein